LRLESVFHTTVDARLKGVCEGAPAMFLRDVGAHGWNVTIYRGHGSHAYRAAQ
jgi:hypothetical protein